MIVAPQLQLKPWLGILNNLIILNILGAIVFLVCTPLWVSGLEEDEGEAFIERSALK